MTALEGQLIRLSGCRNFPGKSRLVRHWMEHRDLHQRLPRGLPGGAKVICDLSIPYESMVWLKQEEERDLQMLRKLLTGRGLFVDCGANIGLWTLTAAAASSGVASFEPNPAVFEKLSRHVTELNDFHSLVQLFPLAVSDERKTLIFQSGAAHNVSSVVEAKSASSIEVRATSLDLELGSALVEGIKMDVEGHEIHALHGATGLLKNQSPWLCIEFNTELVGTGRLGDWSVHRFLRDQGYRPCRFCDAPRWEQATLPDDWRTTGYLNLYYARGRNA